MSLDFEQPVAGHDGPRIANVCAICDHYFEDGDTFIRLEEATHPASADAAEWAHVHETCLVEWSPEATDE